jgi:DNA repair exonuclease SbcCD nuclease subunit
MIMTRKYIFSGHYHKRQATDNVIYIGNPFGTNYADVMDYERGCCLLDLESEEIDFIDYDGPTYVKCKLTDILEERIEIKKRARIKALIDIELSYSDAQLIKKEIIEMYELRELSLEENIKEYNEVLQQSLTELDELDLEMIEETIKKLLSTSIPNNITNINPETLIKIYEEIE